MFIPHVPVEIFIRWMMKLRHNRVFLRVGRILIATLATLTVIGCAGVWGKAYPPDSLPCTIGKYTCYQGEPFGLLDVIYEFGASESLLLIPVIELLSMVILLFKLSRMYLLVCALNFATFLIFLFGMWHSVPVNYEVGGGDLLAFFSACLCAMFCIPLAVVEHININHGYDAFAGWME